MVIAPRCSLETIPGVSGRTWQYTSRLLAVILFATAAPASA